MQANNVGEGAMRGAADLVEAYGRSLVLSKEIAERQAELEGLESVIAPRRGDATFMALLHMLAGGQGAPLPVSSLAAPAASQAVVEDADAGGKAKRRSPDRRGPFENGYGLGASAAREGKPRELDGLKKGWRFRGFQMAYDRVKAGTPLDSAADFRATVLAMGEVPDPEDAGTPEVQVSSGSPEAAGSVLAADAGEPGSGFLPEDGRLDGLEEADASVIGHAEAEAHLPGWSAEPAQEAPVRFPFDEPAGHDLFEGKAQA